MKILSLRYQQRIRRDRCFFLAQPDIPLLIERILFKRSDKTEVLNKIQSFTTYLAMSPNSIYSRDQAYIHLNGQRQSIEDNDEMAQSLETLRGW